MPEVPDVTHTKKHWVATWAQGNKGRIQMQIVHLDMRFLKIHYLKNTKFTSYTKADKHESLVKIELTEGPLVTGMEEK